VGEWPCELIISFLNVLKCDFGYFDESMLNDVESLFERIFFILGIEKSDLDEFEEVMF
jgi:hypothetical protein